jgi:hypothetical protein
LNRREVERAQQPDFKKIWKLEADLANERDDGKTDGLVKQLEKLRLEQPKRHPLWAFFREKTKEDHDDELQYLSADQKGDGSNRPGEFSLAVSIQRPDAKMGRSGTHTLHTVPSQVDY